MSELKQGIGDTDEWYTPLFIFDALGVVFDLDPCSAGRNGEDHVPSTFKFVKADDGLHQEWGDDFVFMNPPFGGRNGHVPWLKKFLDHGNGIAIVRAYTSAGWFHDYAVKADSMVFPRGKTKFLRPDGSVGASPSSGIVLLGMGSKATQALSRSGLGWYVKNKGEGLL